MRAAAADARTAEHRRVTYALAATAFLSTYEALELLGGGAIQGGLWAVAAAAIVLALVGRRTGSRWWRLPAAAGWGAALFGGLVMVGTRLWRLAWLALGALWLLDQWARSGGPGAPPKRLWARWVPLLPGALTLIAAPVVTRPSWRMVLYVAGLGLLGWGAATVARGPTQAARRGGPDGGAPTGRG